MAPEGAAEPVRVRVLGSLRLGDDGAQPRSARLRKLLAVLLVCRGEAVSADRLAQAVWGDRQPADPAAALQNLVWRLRQALRAAGCEAAARPLTRAPGYLLEVEGEQVDSVRFERRVRAAAAEPPDRAVDLLEDALSLWRGPAFAEFADDDIVRVEATRLEELRLTAGCDWVDALLALDRPGETLARLAVMVEADPLRERPRAQLMRALHRLGRTAEALQVYREHRNLLAAELGLDPSLELRNLQAAILKRRREPDRAPPATQRPGLVPLTSFIGRETELEDIGKQLADARLVTLTGAGGVGKTRVALEVARRTGAVAVLRLAPVTDPAAVPHALAAALNLQVARGDVLAACIALLGGGPGVLVVDNCEHLLDAARDVVDALLDGCPELSVLATSREPLGLAGETCSRLGPLALPGPDAPLARVPSVALFVDRAARARPGFAPGPGELRVIADIVRRLDGMPLAIELAAGRMRNLALDDLADRLDRALDLLAGGRPGADARHRTLRATLEWSYGLLPEEEQRLFRHLAVFVDGVDLPTAEAVAKDLRLTTDPGSALAHLVDASVLEVSFAGPARYRMLEPLRAFGLDRLGAAGETDAAEDRLLRWALDLTAWIDEAAGTEREPQADAALRRELTNLRAGWRLARRRGSLDAAIALVLALYEVTMWRDLIEPRGWADELVDDPGLADHPRAGAVLGAAARAAYMRGDYARADRLARVGLARACDRQGGWFCRDALALAALFRGDFAEMVEHKLAAADLVTRPDGGLDDAALAATYAGDLAQARALHERAAASAASPTLRAFGAYVAGEIDNAAGQAERAEEHYRRAVATARTSGATFVEGIASVGLLTVLAAAGRMQDALRGYGEVIEYFARAGNWTQEWVTLRNLAVLLRRLGDAEPAELLDAAADQAPDAPTAGRAPRPASPALGRAQALDVAREAIRRHLLDAPRPRSGRAACRLGESQRDEPPPF